VLENVLLVGLFPSLFFFCFKKNTMFSLLFIFSLIKNCFVVKFVLLQTGDLRALQFSGGGGGSTPTVTKTGKAVLVQVGPGLDANTDTTPSAWKKKLEKLKVIAWLHDMTVVVLILHSLCEKN
jgi:hypothetical protein